MKSYSSRCKTMHLPPTPVIEDITPLTKDTPLEQVLDICLNNMGFMPGLSATKDTPGHSHCYELKQHLENCPTCRASHAVGSNYLVEALVEHCYTVRNEEKSCRSRIIDIKTMVQEHAALKRVLQNPDTDSPLADLYVAERGRNLKEAEGKVHRFDDARGWTPVDMADLDNDVKAFLDHVLDSLNDLLLNEQTNGRAKGLAHADVTDFRKLQDKFLKAARFVQQTNKRSNILTRIKHLVHDSHLSEKWNSCAELLGVANGVIDLGTGAFREARMDDYVTMSCGYDWLETVDPEIEAQVNDFFAKVYPDEQERLLLQQWVGYCLTGRHNEKHLMLLTDQRSGFNGKSTVLSFVAAIMGDYAIKGDASLYYANDKHRTVNDHSAGLMTYEKKRLLYIEETQSNRVFCSSTCKDLNGGDPVMAGRGLYKDAIVQFPWITKTTIAFNENRMPMVDVDDQALMERFLATPHRSRFFAGEVPDEPHSFPADSNVKSLFPTWRPYGLRWALRGLEIYKEQKFKSVPSSCRDFMNAIVQEKDVVREFLDSHVEEGEPSDLVTIGDLYKEYNELYRGLQKDKKTHKSKGSFASGVTRVLERDVKSRHKTHGRCLNSVILGVKRRANPS